MASKGYLEFGPFRLDTSERLLFRDAEPISLTPKAFDTLLALVQNRQHIVGRDELMEIVWPDVAVEENNLTQNISLLRKVLGEGQGERVFIETIPKRGYRFVAEVREPEDEARPAVLSALGDRKKRSRTLWIAGLAAVLTLLAAGVAIFRPRTPVVSAAKIQSLAVLPFENLSGDPGQEYLAEGMTEELITDLAQVHSLRVVSRTSVMRYENKKEPLPEIARELHVGALVEGAVARYGDRVRITAQLIQASSDRHLWAKSYEASLGDVLTVQDTVAVAITQAVQAKLTPAERQRLARAQPVDPAAYRDYLLGRYFANQRTRDGIDKSIEYFQRATLQDGAYAPAHAGLAESYALLAFYGAPSPKVMPKAQTEARQALALDGSLPKAYTALGAVDAVYHWDWAGAELEFRRAIELDPNYVPAYHWYAVLDLAPQGRFAEATAEMQRAQAIDPVSPLIATDSGWIDYLAGHYPQALSQYDRALELDPDFLEAHDHLIYYYLLRGPRDRWIAECVRSLTLDGQGRRATEAEKEYRAGEYQGALRRVMLQRNFSYDNAILYLHEGDRSHAMRWLEDAFTRREPGLIYVKVDPLLSSLHSSAKFLNLLERMRLSPYPATQNHRDHR